LRSTLSLHDALPICSEELNFQKLFELLSRSAAGEKLIKEARFKAGMSGQTLADVVKVGDSSLTDTTLVRKFSPQNPSHVVYESRDRKSTRLNSSHVK